METFISTDIDTFIFNKSIEVFKTLNNMDFSNDDVLLEKTSLSGISNTIFKVTIKVKNSEQLNLHLKIHSVFFKVFGRISVLVDREFETYLMNKLYELSMGAKIYDTDCKTYRIEEYLDELTIFQRERMIDEDVYPQMLKIFSTVNSFGEYNFYFDYIGDQSKETYFEKLKVDSKPNFVNFTLCKMKLLGTKSLMIFKEKFLQDNEKDNSIIDPAKLEKAEFTMQNLDEIFYTVCPNKSILIVNHNDAHPLNILRDLNYKKIVLCDFEYSTYNLIGFDIANYLIEYLFLLSADEFPFYQCFSNNFSELKEEKYFQIFLKYFDYFEQDNSEYFKSFQSYNEIISQCKTRDYYYRVMGISSLLWFVFAIIYLDYDSIKSKSGYDYLSFSIDRLNVYDQFVKNEI